MLYKPLKHPPCNIRLNFHLCPPETLPNPPHQILKFLKFPKHPNFEINHFSICHRISIRGCICRLVGPSKISWLKLTKIDENQWKSMKITAITSRGCIFGLLGLSYDSRLLINACQPFHCLFFVIFIIESAPLVFA